MAQKEPRPKLDWRSVHDPRSMEYRYEAVMEDKTKKQLAPRPKSWRPGMILNQGTEGACVGFGWTAELLADPMSFRGGILGEVTQFARRLYNEARRFDRSMGQNWPSGASVIAGARSVQKLGYIGEYRWAMNMEELQAGIMLEGPVVLGIPWLEGMYETRPSGLTEVHGKVVGGHCITLIGYHPSMRIPGEDYSKRFEVYKWANSWGESYGKSGIGFIKAEDLYALLKGQGEACIPMRRSAITALASF